MSIRRSVLCLALAALISGVWAASSVSKGPWHVYVGTYTDKGSKGIYAYRFDSKSGKLDSIGLAAETQDPTFLAVHPSFKYLYAVNEVNRFNGERTGSVSAYRINSATGKLTFLNVVSSRGTGPAHLTVDRGGKFVLVANYGGGSIAALAINADGSLGDATASIQHKGSSVNPRRQREPHAHSINMSPDNRFAIVADLGLDKLLVYRFDAAKGTLEPNHPPSVSLKPGAGPRHFAFHPNGRVAYAINEIASTVTVFDWNAANGVFTEKQTVTTLPKDFSGENSTAEVVVHPNGKFLYGSNRGHDSVAIFSIAKDGTLTPVDVTPLAVKTPRNFAIDPSGGFLFAEGQASGGIVLFRIDSKTGRLTPAGTSVEITAPVCIRFGPVNAT